MKYILPLCLFVFLLSCQDLKKEKQIQSVSNLIKTTDSIDSIFKANYNDSIGKIISSVMDVELRIKRNYKSDTIDKALAKKVNRYKMVRKKLKPIGRKYNQISTGCKEERFTLMNLKKDIENNAGNESKYDEYISHEKRKVKQLNLILKEFVEGQTESLTSYYELHQEMYDFSMALTKK